MHKQMSVNWCVCVCVNFVGVTLFCRIQAKIHGVKNKNE